MILVICMHCSYAVRIMPAQAASPMSLRELEQLVGAQSPFWPEAYPCLRCESSARGFLESAVDASTVSALHVQDVTPQEAFAAFHGLGLPGEQQCSLPAVQTLLREQPIRRILGSDTPGTERAIVDALELWDGTRVYFGAAPEGAVIYRITRPVSYVAQQDTEVR